MTDRKSIDMAIVRNPTIETTTKYFYVCLLMELECAGYNCSSLCADGLSFNCGISKAKIYRARSQLIKLGVLRLTKKFCSDTGKRLEDIYELI
jgi:hypothetical protein